MIKIPGKTTSEKLLHSGKITCVIKKSSNAVRVYEYTVDSETNALCRLVMYKDNSHAQLDIQISADGTVQAQVRAPSGKWVNIFQIDQEAAAVKPSVVQVVVPSAHGTLVRPDKDGKMIVCVEVPVLAVEPFEEGKLLLTIGSNLDEFKSPTSSSAPPTAEQS